MAINNLRQQSQKSLPRNRKKHSNWNPNPNLAEDHRTHCLVRQWRLGPLSKQLQCETWNKQPIECLHITFLYIYITPSKESPKQWLLGRTRPISTLKQNSKNNYRAPQPPKHQATPKPSTTTPQKTPREHPEGSPLQQPWSWGSVHSLAVQSPSRHTQPDPDSSSANTEKDPLDTGKTLSRYWLSGASLALETSQHWQTCYYYYPGVQAEATLSTQTSGHLNTLPAALDKEEHIYFLHLPNKTDTL